MSVYYTLIYKSHHCPMWDIDVSIEGKYRFYDDEHPNIGKFVSCKCPVLENLKLPPIKQNVNYKIFRFCNMDSECLKSVNFPPTIDAHK